MKLTPRQKHNLIVLCDMMGFMYLISYFSLLGVALGGAVIDWNEHFTGATLYTIVFGYLLASAVAMITYNLLKEDLNYSPWNKRIGI